MTILRRLEIDRIVDQMEVREPFAGQVDVTFNMHGEGMLVMVSDKTDVVRVVGRRSESDVEPAELEYVLRSWGDA